MFKVFFILKHNSFTECYFIHQKVAKISSKIFPLFLIQNKMNQKIHNRSKISRNNMNNPFLSFLHLPAWIIILGIYNMFEKIPHIIHKSEKNESLPFLFCNLCIIASAWLLDQFRFHSIFFSFFLSSISIETFFIKKNLQSLKQCCYELGIGIKRIRIWFIQNKN